MWKLEKFPFDSELEKYEGEVIVTGYNIKTVLTSSKYQIFSSKKFFKSGQKPITEETITSNYPFRSSFLWFNSLLRVEDRQISFLKNGSSME